MQIANNSEENGVLGIVIKILLDILLVPAINVEAK
jgi:hypothetical protein